MSPVLERESVASASLTIGEWASFQPASSLRLLSEAMTVQSKILSGIKGAELGKVICVFLGDSNVKIIFGAIFLIVNFALAAYTLEEEKDLIVIDPGHGGADRGAIGWGGLEEKEVTLDIAKRLKRSLESPLLTVLLTRQEDKLVSFRDRSGLANSKGADLFVSLHTNASPSQDIGGFEVWHLRTPRIEEIVETDDYTRSILADHKRHGIMEESFELANLIRKDFAVGFKDRGVWGGRILPLSDLKMPAVLVEIGFITNPLEEHRLRDTVIREEIAKGLARAILEFRRQKTEDRR